MTASPLLILVDGHSLAFRSYYAHAKKGGLTTSTGIPTSVTFGFIKSLIEVIEQHRPQGVLIAFDLSTPTFRHAADPTYKADRKETPADFLTDVENLYQLLSAFNLPILTAPGYEADDLLATLAYQGIEQGYRVKILTGDRDLFQLVDDSTGISILYFSRDQILEMQTAGVVAKLGVLPSQVVDYKALCGDKSDNIPGVPGIGEKTAVQLLNQYHDLDTIYTSLDKITATIQKKLTAGHDSAFHSRYMAKIKTDAPIVMDADAAYLQGFDPDRVKPILERLELNYFSRNLAKIQASFGGQTSPPPSPTRDQQDQDNQNNQIYAEDEDTWFFSPADTQQSSPAPALQPEIIITSTQLTQLIEKLKAAPITAWDTETTALDPLVAALVGIGCCWGDRPQEVAYIPLGHKNGEQLPQEEVLAALQPLLEDATHSKVLQNAKYDRLILKNHNINLAGVTCDTMLTSYILNPDNSHGLKEMAQTHLGIVTPTYEQIVPRGQAIDSIDIPTVAHYCAMDAHLTYRLALLLPTQLTPELADLLNQVELPLEPVLAEMEATGIRINATYLQQFSQQLEQDLYQIEQQAYASAGSEFNLNSPKQLGQILFEKLQIGTDKIRKTKTGAYSTDHATLEKLQDAHPVIAAILEHRTLSKLKSTYVDALPQLLNPKTQRIHTDFNQAKTSTGRLSSSDPNLQNIPIRTSFSRQIRQAFIPEEGWLLVAADYSQIELRILAHLSQEPTLLRAYQNNADIHTVTAQLLFEKEVISSEERRLAKVINFGVIYGMGAQKFARESGFPVSQAKKFIEKFNQEYSLVFAYLEKLKRLAISQGYVTTVLGRRRYFQFEGENLKRLKGQDPESIDLGKIKMNQHDAQLLRAAANSPIQGSSADIIKRAMVKLHETLRNYQSRLLLQVHDELVLEVPPQEWPELQPLIKDAMESAVSLSVPLVVEVRAGKNWMEAK